MIFIPNKDFPKLGLLAGKGIKIDKVDAEKLVKKGFGIIKIIRRKTKSKK